MPDEKQFAQPPKWLIPGIIMTLFVWAIVIAVGALRAADSNSATVYLKPLLILGTVAAFVGVWVLMLRSRSNGRGK